MNKRVLVIAGLDPSGGAGIVADIEAAHACGTHAQAVVTALTVQNDGRYVGHEPVSASLMDRQLKTLFDDHTPDAIKIGMLPSFELAEVLVRRLKAAVWRGPLVWDTVFAASAGGALIPPDEIEPTFQILQPYVSGITPNLGEGQILAGRTVTPEDTPAAIYSHYGCKSPFFVLLKGGHGGDEEVTDLLYDGRCLTPFRHLRVRGDRPPRGTGCRLATAVAAFLSQGLELSVAVKQARKMVLHYIRSQTSARS